MTDSSCHSTERHRKVGHTSLPSPGFFSFQQRRGWRVSSMMLCLSTAVYRNSASYASLVTSKTFMLYTWYSLVCMLNFSVALVLRIIWIKIVLKNHACESQSFSFFFFFSSSKKNYTWKSQNFYLKPETHFTSLHPSSHGSNLWQFQDSSETCVFSDIVFYLLKGFEICLFVRKEFTWNK